MKGKKRGRVKEGRAAQNFISTVMIPSLVAY